MYRYLDEHRKGCLVKPGDPIELSITPDRYLTVRYAGASGDFNPIHIDDEYAKQVGLPGRILHGAVDDGAGRTRTPTPRADPTS
jgi:hypothetical protein